MKSATLVFIGVVLSLPCLGDSSPVAAQDSQKSRVTLYSVHKHRGEQLRSCVNFKVSPAGFLRTPCDLRYGALYAGDDLDWFESSTAQGNRSVIKDLGDLNGTTKIEVPVVEPLAKLKPSEQRQVTVDTSGADGADGAPGANGAKGQPASLGPLDTVGTAETPTPPKVLRPKHDGKPKIDPLFVKAIIGHVYVIHVVDDSRDFYALFRVEALERGDYCTVSWKLIPDPSKQNGRTALR